MSLRTPADLSSALHEDLGWRRKELIVFRGLVESTKSSKQQAILRGAIAALYAHWEGFVKNAAQRYLEFVKLRRLNLCDLSDGFVALSFKKKMASIQAMGKPEPNLEFVEWLLEEWPRRASLPGAEAVSAYSNLNVDRFKSIISIVGLSYRSEFALAERLIDRLLEIRNNLAHGEWQTVEMVEYLQLHDEIDRLLVLVCNDIDAAASTGSYRRSRSTAENAELLADLRRDAATR